MKDKVILGVGLAGVVIVIVLVLLALVLGMMGGVSAGSDSLLTEEEFYRGTYNGCMLVLTSMHVTTYGEVLTNEAVSVYVAGCLDAVDAQIDLEAHLQSLPGWIGVKAFKPAIELDELFKYRPDGAFRE